LFILFVFVVPYVYLLYDVCIAVLTLDAGLLARSQYPEAPATGHLDIGFSWFPCVFKRMLRWFPSFQVATTCFSCSPPDLNFLVSYLIFVYMLNNHCHRVTTQLRLINIIISAECRVNFRYLYWQSQMYWLSTEFPILCH